MGELVTKQVVFTIYITQSQCDTIAQDVCEDCEPPSVSETSSAAPGPAVSCMLTSRHSDGEVYVNSSCE